MFLVTLVYALFASVFTVAKTALDYSSPVFLVGSRMFVAGLLLLGYQFLFRRENFFIHKKDLLRLSLLAIFAIYLTNIFEFWGLQYLTSFKTCFIYSLSPFVSALLSYVVLKEIMSLKKWAGLMIGFLGFIPILLSHTQSEAEMGQLWVFSWAELSVLVAAICSVYGWILLKQVITENRYPPVMANGITMTLGGFIALVHSYLVENWDPIPVTEYLPFAVSAIVLIIVSNILCYNLYGYLLKRFSATFVSFAGFTTPLFTALFGWFFLGETVTWPFYSSFAIVFIGLLLFYQDELSQEFYGQKQAI